VTDSEQLEPAHFDMAMAADPSFSAWWCGCGITM
jgi:hypothetical protein